MKLIDSHCHLHDSQFFPENRQEVYQQMVQAGIGAICVGTDERSSKEAVEWTSDREMVWAAVGVHPHETKLGWSGIERLLQSNSSNKIVAIGEIGLDFYYNHSPRGTQINGLEGQLQLALDYNLPVSFHIRDAFDDFWPIFDNFPGIRGVMHSFTDTQANLERGFERGLFVGLNGISTFTKDTSQAKMYHNTPLDRLLLETDAPYLTPKPNRGKMNEPRFVELVANYWAGERDISLDEICRITRNNTRSLFGI